jgi:hypothetical protein
MTFGNKSTVINIRTQASSLGISNKDIIQTVEWAKRKLRITQF